MVIRSLGEVITGVCRTEVAILHGEMDAFENAGRQPARVYQQSVIYTHFVSVCHVYRCNSAVRHS